MILLGFKNGRAGRVALFAYAEGTALSRCGRDRGLRTCGGRRRRGYRTKASGRRVVR